MEIERRKNLRVPLSFDVVLNHRAQSVICTVRDICLGGAFLDAEPELLPYSGAVELSFSLSTDSSQNYVRFPATIRRVTGDGVAVSFGDMGRDLYFQLVDLITLPYSKSSGQSSPH